MGIHRKKYTVGWIFNSIGKRPDNEAMIKHLGAGRITGIAENLVNVLEGVTIPMHPQIARIKSQLMEQGALGSLMSGTGPTVYGVFKDQSSAHRAAKGFEKGVPPHLCPKDC